MKHFYKMYGLIQAANYNSWQLVCFQRARPESINCRYFGTACFSINAISQIAFQFAAISLVSPLWWEIETYTRY